MNLKLYILNIPETNHVSRVHSVVDVPYLQIVLYIKLFRPRNIFRTLTLALPVICVQCPIWLIFFCSSLISCFHVMFLRYCMSDFEMVPLAPIIKGITFASTFHMR